MRQSGYLAAAGIYALDHHIDRLAADHQRAKVICELLRPLPFIAEINPVDTNIVIFTLADRIETGDFLARLKGKGVLAVSMGPRTVRMVTHLDFTDEMLTILARALKEL